MAVLFRPQPFEDYYIDPAIGRIGKGKMNTNLSASEARDFRQMMSDAGWVERHVYETKQVYYKNKYSGEHIYRNELLGKSPHEFSSFIYASKMACEAEKSQSQIGFMEDMCYDDYERRKQQQQKPNRGSAKRSSALVRAMDNIPEGQAVCYENPKPKPEKSGIEKWQAGQASWAREPIEYLRQRVDKWVK